MTDKDTGVDVPIQIEESAESTESNPLEETAERAIEGFDSGVVDVLSWLLETETKARLYIYLQAEPASTSDEIAKGTGLYPSTVREAIADLYREDVVSREKRETGETGNDPYEYRSIPPSELIQRMVGDVQDQLQEVLKLDRSVDAEEDGTDVDPITITVDPDGDEDEGEGLGTSGDE